MILKLRSTFETFGFVNGMLYFIDRSLARISYNRIRLFKYYLVIQTVPESPLLSPRRGKSISIRRITAEESEVVDFPRPRHVIESRYKQNGYCLAAFKDHEIVGYLWLNFTAYEEDEVRSRFIPLPQRKAVWDYDVYVKPRYRLSPIFARLWDEANRLLRERKIKWTISRISAFNPGSISSHARMDSIRVGFAVFICVGNAQFMIASVYPYVHISCRKTSYPHIYLNAEKFGL